MLKEYGKVHTTVFFTLVMNLRLFVHSLSMYLRGV